MKAVVESAGFEAVDGTRAPSTRIDTIVQWNYGDAGGMFERRRDRMGPPINEEESIPFTRRER